MKMIYHIPWAVAEGRQSAPAIRPKEMLKAFQSIAEVEVVWGSGEARSERFAQLKKRIKDGEHFDFVYSESSTTPTLLASGWRDGLRFGNQDLNFLRFCKRQGIPVGLFYRDIFWKFSDFSKGTPFHKRLIINYLHGSDLRKYGRTLTTMFLPNMAMKPFIGDQPFSIEELPPGLNILQHKDKQQTESLSLFYVGGIGKNYQIHNLLRAVSELKGVALNLCTRKLEWEANKDQYSPWLHDNIHVIHLSGDEMVSLLKDSDIGVLFLKPEKYWDFAMPVKLFEYLSMGKPVIASSGTAAGEWIAKNQVGWAIPYEAKSLADLLCFLKRNLKEISEKKMNIRGIIHNNTWDTRAKRAANVLKFDNLEKRS